MIHGVAVRHDWATELNRTSAELIILNLRGKMQTTVNHTRKTSTSALLITPKPLTVYITTIWGIFFKRLEYQTTLTASWEMCMHVKEQQLEPDMEKQTGSKLGKEDVKAVCRHPACLTYMQSTSWEMLDQMKHKVESRLLGEISIPQICRWHHHYGRMWKRTKEPLDESERGECKIWLKTQHSENKDHGIRSHHFKANRWGNNGHSERLYFLGLQNHCRWWLQPWN